MKAKAVLLVIMTLLIGFVLGILTSAEVRFHRLRPFRIYYSEEHFRKGFYEMIQPDVRQKAEIERILNKYARMNSDLQAGMRKTLEANIKEMRKELDSRLTKEQLERLKQMDERRQNMIMHFRRNQVDSINRRRMNPPGYPGRFFPDNRQMPPPMDNPPFPPDDTNSVTR